MTKPEDFKPFKLVGDWKFVNSNTFRNYGGDVEITLRTADSLGRMHGEISYDGRQTNDSCSTKMLSDKPAEVLVIKVDIEYRVTFKVECLKGESPRELNWTLICKDGVCSRSLDQSWGKGVMTLTEKR